MFQIPGTANRPYVRLHRVINLESMKLYVLTAVLNLTHATELNHIIGPEENWATTYKCKQGPEKHGLKGHGQSNCK